MGPNKFGIASEVTLESLNRFFSLSQLLVGKAYFPHVIVSIPRIEAHRCFDSDEGLCRLGLQI
jgi:hypothetical protein